MALKSIKDVIINIDDLDEPQPQNNMAVLVIGIDLKNRPAVRCFNPENTGDVGLVIKGLRQMLKRQGLIT